MVDFEMALAFYRLSGNSAPKHPEHLKSVSCLGFAPGFLSTVLGLAIARLKVPMLAFGPIVPNTVFVEKPAAMSYTDAMLRLRTWLDHKKIAGFTLFTGGRIGFDRPSATRWHARVLSGASK